MTRAAPTTPRRQVTAPGGAARRRRAARLLAACIGAATPAVADPAADAPADAAPAELEDTQDALRSEAFQSDVRAGFSRNYWVVGPTLEYFTSAAKESLSRGDELLGLSAMWRLGSFGPHALLLSKPNVTRFADSRFLAGLGLRGFVDIPGLTEISYGVGGHVEIRLEDHFWLGYLTPLELGGVVWDKNSWRIEIFVGARRAIAGKLINFYLIDPNGFDSQDAQADLDDSRRTWRAFTRIVFGRRID